MATTTTHTKVERLVAMDWADKGLDPAPVLAFIGDALISHEVTTTPRYHDQSPAVTHLFTFDGRQVRNTEVHGASFHAGFTSHIESVS